MKAELETHILVNQQDVEEGYFWIYTSYAAHAKRVQQRYANGILDTKECRANGETTEWKFKMDKAYLPKGGFTLRSCVKSHRPATDKQRALLLAGREKQKAAKHAKTKGAL